MKKRILIANWKMNGSMEDVVRFSSFFRDKTLKCTVVFCPPVVFLRDVLESSIFLGAQDCSAYTFGAYTGDVSAGMLKEIGVSYVIVGHSECRLYRKDTDSLIQKKVDRVLEAGLIPIICVGETREEKESGLTYFVLERSCAMFASLSNLVMIAYEPIWCIGSGIIPKLEEIQNIHKFIYNICSADILYGGSLNASNIQRVFSLEEVHGGLVGTASLDVEEFYQMVQAC